MRFRRFAILLLLAANGPAQEQDRPFPPHQVIGNVYFVGTASLGCFLVATPQGNILINSGFEETVPVVRASIERLGFRFEDIKILLTSHAHDDHVGGHALVKKQTGARVLVMEGDEETVETGFGGRWAACPVDRVLHDGDQVTLGGVTLVAHHTPGHTPGCTSWSLAVPEGGRTYNVVIVGSLNVSSRLLGNTEYPEIVSDFLQSIGLLERLPCDVFLGAHGSYYRLREKYAKLEKGGPNPFIDPEGYRRYIKEREEALLARLAEERKATRR